LSNSSSLPVEQRFHKQLRKWQGPTSQYMASPGSRKSEVSSVTLWGGHRLIHNRPWCKLRDEDGGVRLARPLDRRGHSSAYGIGRIAPTSPFTNGQAPAGLHRATRSAPRAKLLAACSRHQGRTGARARRYLKIVFRHGGRSPSCPHVPGHGRRWVLRRPLFAARMQFPIRRSPRVQP
jgi:hypothetical protein